MITRLESSLTDPFVLEKSGHALFDIHPQRRGNLFSDEVYRLQKADDATTKFYTDNNRELYPTSPLPSNHKFSRNDVIVLTLQPSGTGDFLSATSLPTNPDALMLEARVLNVGPTYIDVAVSPGQFSRVFGPASNNVGEEGRGDPKLRVRVDRFFSDVPFRRMVAALGQLTAVPENNGKHVEEKRVGGFQMDNLLKDLIISTLTRDDDINDTIDDWDDNALRELVSASVQSVFYKVEPDISYLYYFDLQSKKLAKPPLPSSVQLTNQVMSYIDANPNDIFPRYNEPQMTAIRAALTRRMTMIQGPPGKLLFLPNILSVSHVLNMLCGSYRYWKDNDSRLNCIRFRASMPQHITSL